MTQHSLAYISTEALVTTPTSLLQLGNGSRKSRPTTAVMTIPSTGTLVRSELRSNAAGMWPFLLRPKPIRDAEVK
jgi:hypothetical protein